MATDGAIVFEVDRLNPVVSRSVLPGVWKPRRGDLPYGVADTSNLCPAPCSDRANPPKRLQRCPARGEISEMRRKAQVSPKASEDRRRG